MKQFFNDRGCLFLALTLGMSFMQNAQACSSLQIQIANNANKQVTTFRNWAVQYKAKTENSTYVTYADTYATQQSELAARLARSANKDQCAATTTMTLQFIKNMTANNIFLKKLVNSAQ